MRTICLAGLVTLSACGASPTLEPGSLASSAGAVKTSPDAELSAVDLGTLGGKRSFPDAINAQGHAVGGSDTSGNAEFHAFLWTRDDGMVDLGTLGGVFSEASAVSDAGHVVGTSYLPDSSMHAFLWTKADGMLDLGPGEARAVSNSGVVIGSYFDGEDRHGFVWSRTRGRTDLGENTLPSAVNARGDVVGRSSQAGWEHPFLWTKEGEAIDLGTLGGRSGFAVAVSDDGKVVGETYAADEIATHPFLWTRTGGMIDLGTLGGAWAVAWDVSNGGHVVGASTSTPGSLDQSESHPFLWTRMGGMTNLDTAGRRGGSAMAVSGSGRYVAGGGLVVDDQVRGFLWSRQTGLEVLGGVGGYTGAVDVNDRGQALGFVIFGSGRDAAFHAALWSSGSRAR